MNDDQYKAEFELYKKLIKKVSPYPTGGQHINIVKPTVKLVLDELSLEIIVGSQKSQLDNFQIAYDLMFHAIHQHLKLRK